ncbi:MAG: energy transducer TonB [Bacteroidales bacterium]|nr:energy transducer TonB [Bacteroidales bacterium]
MVKLIINITFIFLVSINAIGQVTCNDSLQIFGTPEELPKPEITEIQRVIISKINYPVSAAIDSVEGTVWVTFCIDTCGGTSNHKVIKGVRFDLDEEALRVSKLIIFDEPAKNRGVPVLYRCTIPVKFELSTKKKQKTIQDD